MKNQLDQRQILNVFEKITRFGKVTERGHQLEGVEAFTDADSYRVYLSFEDMVLTLGFHNQYHFDYPDSQPLKLFKLSDAEAAHHQHFLAQVEKIDASY